MRQYLMDMEVFLGIVLECVGRETADFVNEHLPKNLINALSSEEMTTIEQCLEYAYYFTDIESKDGDVKTIIINYTSDEIQVNGTSVAANSAAVVEGGVK